MITKERQIPGHSALPFFFKIIRHETNTISPFYRCTFFILRLYEKACAAIGRTAIARR